MEEQEIVFHYVIKFENGDVYEKRIVVDKVEGILKNPEKVYPAMDSVSRLDFCQCKNCPYNLSDFTHCPAMVNMGTLINIFKNHPSTEEVESVVYTKNRVFHHTGSLHTSLCSLMGLLMATSLCEHFDFLKPMAKTHLPFSDVEETLLRTVSYYLLDRFLCGSNNFTLDDLKDKYSELEIVNQGILERLHSMNQSKDAEANAVVILDTFIKMFSLEYDISLEDLKTYFSKGKDIVLF